MVPEKALQILGKSLEGLFDAAWNLIPDSWRKLLKKIYSLVQEGAQLLKDTSLKTAQEEMYLLRALLMEVVNGLLSLLQILTSIIGWIISPTDYNKILTGETFQKYQSYLEMVEDMFDFLSAKASDFFSAVKSLIKDFSYENIKSVLAVFAGKITNLSRYDYAFFAGSFLFEVVTGVLLALATGGASAIAQAANETKKFLTFLRIVAQETVSTITLGISNALKLLKILFIKFVQACKKGWDGFRNFIENLFHGKTDDIVSSKGKVFDDIDLDYSEEIFRKILKGSDGGKRYTRSALKKIALDIEKQFSNLGLKVEIVTKHNLPLRLKDWRIRGVFGSCNTRKIPPTMFLRHDATELTIQHEIWHIEDFNRLGYEAYNNLPDWKNGHIDLGYDEKNDKYFKIEHK